MEVYKFNKNISAEYNSLSNWINYLSWRWNNFLDSLFGTSFFGRSPLYDGNPMTNEDKLVFTRNLKQNLVNLFFVVYIPKGIKFVRKTGPNLEKMIQ